MLNKYLSRTVETADGCRVWQGCLNSDGYPRAGTKGDSNIKVHREVFCLVNGYYPEIVRHKCDNIKCINPDHLEGGTPIDNVNDRNERGRTFGQVSKEEVELVSQLLLEGMLYKEIANALNVKYKRVQYIINSYVKPSSK